MYYSKSTGGFYSSEIHGDSIPADAVEITKDKHQALLGGQSQGKRIAADADGLPILIDPPPPQPPTRELVEALRLRAYADPLTGSDRHFAEAARLQVMGATAEEVDAAKAAGATRYAEIQSQYPWPVSVS